MENIVDKFNNKESEICSNNLINTNDLSSKKNNSEEINIIKEKNIENETINENMNNDTNALNDIKSKSDNKYFEKEEIIKNNENNNDIIIKENIINKNNELIENTIINKNQTNNYLGEKIEIKDKQNNKVNENIQEEPIILNVEQKKKEENSKINEEKFNINEKQETSKINKPDEKEKIIEINEHETAEVSSVKEEKLDKIVNKEYLNIINKPGENEGKKNSEIMKEKIIKKKSNDSSDSESDESESNNENIINTNNKDNYFPKGIKNLGLNCYMNSLLQCLFNIPKLRNYFIEGLKNKTFNKDSHPICYSFAKIMEKLLYSDKKYITPKLFKELISAKNPLFKDNKAADATDLFRNLIDSFLDEIKSNSICGFEEGETPEGENTNDKSTLFKEIKNEMKNNFIYSILNVYNIVTYYCPIHKQSDNISIESDSNITFSLENIIENSNRNKDTPITIEECFKYNQKLRNNRQFYCSICKKVVKGNSNEKIFYPPEILIIILNRGHGKTFKGYVSIDTILDISEFIDMEGRGRSGYDNNTYYRLICSCNHSGKSSPTGHYTATCYNEEKESYYYYSDKYFKKIKTFKYSGEPYMLFYKRIKMNDYNDRSKEIKNIIILSKDYIMSKEKKDKFKKTLEIIYEYFKENNNKDYSIQLYKNYLFTWKVVNKGKASLIMDFSNPPKYDLSSITYIEDNKKSVSEYLDFNCNITIHLKEKYLDIYEKINYFLENFYRKSNVSNRGCKDICIII